MAKSPPDELGGIDALLEIMAALRDPEGGCPWDLEQTFKTIAPYTLEEAYEVVDAIRENDMAALKDELGDLLLQVVYHARMAGEAGHFDFSDVVNAISNKMIRRHPHVFGEAKVSDVEAQSENWETIKAAERAKKGSSNGLLDGIPNALPALLLAEKLTKRAARVGFDWDGPEQVYEKLTEEVGEVKEAAASGDPEALADELGDVLFVLANLCRKYGVNPEEALGRTNAKFRQRFAIMEREAGDRGLNLSDLTLARLEQLWDGAKAHESAKKQR